VQWLSNIHDGDFGAVLEVGDELQGGLSREASSGGQGDELGEHIAVRDLSDGRIEVRYRGVMLSLSAMQ